MTFADVIDAAIEQAEAEYGKDDRWIRVHNYRAARFVRKHFRGSPVTYIHATLR